MTKEKTEEEKESLNCYCVQIVNLSATWGYWSIGLGCT